MMKKAKACPLILNDEAVDEDPPTQPKKEKEERVTEFHEYGSVDEVLATVGLNMKKFKRNPKGDCLVRKRYKAGEFHHVVKRIRKIPGDLTRDRASYTIKGMKTKTLYYDDLLYLVLNKKWPASMKRVEGTKNKGASVAWVGENLVDVGVVNNDPPIEFTKFRGMKDLYEDVETARWFTS